MPDEKEPIPQFAARIKQKYPEYKDINDTVLVQKIVEKYPEYRDSVDLTGIETTVKKKDTPSLSASASTGLSPSKDDDISKYALPNAVMHKEYEAKSGVPFDPNDPVTSAKLSILRSVKKPRITQPANVSSTAAKRPMQERLQPVQPESEGVSFAEASKDMKAVENFYRGSTDRSVAELSKVTGLNKEQLYSDAYDDQIKQSIQQGNATQRLAYEALQDAKKANKVIQGGGTIEDMAVRLAGLNDPMIQKQIENQSQQSPIEGQMFGKGTVGRFMFDMTNNPAFQQELNNYPELKKEFKQEAANISKNYPEFGKAHFGNMISQKMEQMGINNGIVNVVTKGEFDKVVKALKDEGQISLADEAFINENLRSDTGLKGLGKQVIGRENISTPGLVENVLQGGFTGVENLGKGVAEVTGLRDALQSEQDALKTDVERSMTDVNVKPEGLWHEITNYGGKFMGQSLSIAGGGGAIKALKIAKNPAVALGLSGGIQAYANYAPEARMLFPGDVIKQRGYTTLMASIEALTENIFRDDKVVKGLMKGLKPSIRNTIEDFTQKKISASVAGNNVIGAVMKAAEPFSKAVVQNVGEEFAAGALGGITRGVFEGKPMSEWMDAEDLAETVKMAFIGSPFIAALSTRADLMKNKGISSKQVYLMARDPEYWATQMQEAAKMDEDLANELPDKLQNLQYATDLLKELDSQEGLTEKQKAKYLLTSLDSKIKEQNLSQKTDPILKAKEDAATIMAIQKNEQLKQDIVEGKDDGSYDGDRSDDLSKQEIKAAKILAEAAIPEMYQKAAEENPISVLQDIAKQAQNTNDDFMPINDGMEEENMRRAKEVFGEKVVDEAIKLFPKNQAEQSQTEGAAENVVPFTLENDIRQRYIDDFNIVEDSSFDWRVTSQLSTADRKKAVRDIKAGKETAATKKLEQEIKEAQERGTVIINRGRGNQAQSVEIPINEWFGLNPKEQNQVFEDAEKLDENAVRIINESNITLQNIDDLNYLFNGFPYEQSDFTAVKDYLTRQGEGNPQAAPISEGSEAIPPTQSGEGQPPISEPPPPTDEGGKEKKFENNPKAILNRVYESKNISESVKERFRQQGLTYTPKTHEEARTVAKEMINEFGTADAVSMAEAGRFDGDVNSMVFAEAIDRTFVQEQAATTQEEKIRLAEQWADYAIRYDESARSKGRFISAIYDFYRKSPLGVILSERAKRDEAFKEWFTKREKPFKEVWEELQKEPEFQEILKQKVGEQVKQERAANRMKRRKKIEDIFDKAKFKGDQLSASILPPPIWNAAVEVMKQATLAGESIVNVIQQGVDYIKANHKDAWDEQSFRDEWMDKLGGIDKEGKIELTDEEKKQRILDKFRKKLSGLTEEQKEDVIRKSFKKLVDSGALEYDDFKKIVADVIGLGELSPDEVTKLTGFVKDMNAVQDLSDALLKNETKENLAAFEKGVKQAEQSATKLAGMLYTKAKVAQRLRSIIQLNTLGIVSLIKNPFYNIFHQLLVRLPKGIFMTILDQAVYAGSIGLNKIAGTPIVKPDVNILLGQKGYWSKGTKGGLESVKQVFTGLTNKDYFQKEVYNSQIKPFTAWKDLWKAATGKKNLTKGQIADKALQGTLGVPAEMVARLLNIGDKPFRFAAEAAIAETIGRQQLGLSGFELEVFMRLPKEKAKQIYLKKGLSEEDANKKTELIEQRIIKEGEEAVFQQNNVVSDTINKLKQAIPSGQDAHPMASFASGAAKMVGLLNMPFVKTPSNIAWEVFNLVNPEFALLQSFIYGVRAAKSGSQSDYLKAKKWMAHAATGWALLAAAGYLASIGAVSGDDEDEPYKAKEAKGKGTYDKPHSINMTKLWRAVSGDTTSTLDGDVNVDLSWFGAMGMIMNMQANKYENLTDEERENMAYIDDILFRLNRGAQDATTNSIFQGSLTAVDAFRSGRYDQWLSGMLNVGMNAIEPATLAQISRATRPTDYKVTGDDLSQTLSNQIKSRFFGKLTPKVNVWGEEMKREGSAGDVALRMLGFSQADTDKFARPIFEDFKRTGDANFFPPAIMPRISVSGEERRLNSEEILQFETLIGQARKNIVAPFVNDQAYIKADKKRLKYSQMNDDQKLETLKDLYKKGYDAGKKLFIKLHPEFKND